MKEQLQILTILASVMVTLMIVANQCFVSAAVIEGVLR